MITVTERAEAITRAKQALTHIEEHPATTKSNLGAARDQLNLVHNWNDPRDVWDAVQGLEALVVEIYGRIPTDPSAQSTQSAESAQAGE